MVVLAADASPSPSWLGVVTAVTAVAVAFLAAFGPVWLEKFKNRNNPVSQHKVSDAEAVLREWLQQAIKERDRALKDVDKLNKRIDQLERELWRRGWDGRTA